MGIPNKNRLSWMTREMRKEIKHLDKIAKHRDIEGLFQLNDDDYFSIAIRQIFTDICDYKPDILNHPQKVLFLCMMLEDFGQADTILEFFIEFPDSINEIVNALYEIESINSAELISQVVEMLPKNISLSEIMADDNCWETLKKIDSKFSSYPDGRTSVLYRKFAEKHRDELF